MSVSESFYVKERMMVADELGRRMPGWIGVLEAWRAREKGAVHEVASEVLQVINSESCSGGIILAGISHLTMISSTQRFSHLDLRDMIR